MTGWKMNTLGWPDNSPSKFLAFLKRLFLESLLCAGERQSISTALQESQGPRVTRGTPQRFHFSPLVIKSCLLQAQCSILIIYTFLRASEFTKHSPVSHPGAPSQRLCWEVFGLGFMDEASERSAALPEFT